QRNDDDDAPATGAAEGESPLARAGQGGGAQETQAAESTQSAGNDLQSRPTEQGTPPAPTRPPESSPSSAPTAPIPSTAPTASTASPAPAPVDQTVPGGQSARTDRSERSGQPAEVPSGQPAQAAADTARGPAG